MHVLLSILALRNALIVVGLVSVVPVTVRIPNARHLALTCCRLPNRPFVSRSMQE